MDKGAPASADLEMIVSDITPAPKLENGSAFLAGKETTVLNVSILFRFLYCSILSEGNA